LDKFGVIWMTATGQPEKIADMVLTPKQICITNPQRRILAALLERSVNVRGMPIILKTLVRSADYADSLRLSIS
jgi:flagellar biosynthesis component FlhA